MPIYVEIRKAVSQVKHAETYFGKRDLLRYISILDFCIVAKSACQLRHVRSSVCP